MKQAVVLAAALVLAALHQDSWFRDDPTIVLGFLPIGLAYHVGYTLAAALFWYAVLRLAWPAEALRASNPDRPGHRG